MDIRKILNLYYNDIEIQFELNNSNIILNIIWKYYYIIQSNILYKYNFTIKY